MKNDSRSSAVWSMFLSQYFADDYQHVYAPTLLIDRKTLIKSKYVEHFPQQMFEIENTEQYITPAACLHVYPNISGKKVQNCAYFGIAHCGRREGGRWDPPYRLPDFYMAELVCIGSQNYVQQFLQSAEKKVEEMFGRLGIEGSFELATDAFFLGNDDGAKIMQKLKGLKREFVVNDGDKTVALMSINNHETFFGKQFDITTDATVTHTACVAFGISRLATYSTRLWGTDVSSWPHVFRSYADIS